MNDMDTQTFDDLGELWQRGRMFSEMFPGTAAGDAWRAAFDAAHPRGKKDQEDLRGHGGQPGNVKRDRDK